MRRVQGSFKYIIQSIRTCYKTIFPHRNHIQTNTVRQRNLPIILRYPRYYLTRAQFPPFAHVTVFNPQIRISSRKRDGSRRVLHKDCRVRFHLPMHDKTLVANFILYSQRRRNKLTTCSVMIKLSSGQRQYGNGKTIQLFIYRLRMATESKPIIGIEIIIGYLAGIFI